MPVKLTTAQSVTVAEACAAADEVEHAIGEICNGRRKPGSIPMQARCSLVQFVRDEAAKQPAPADTGLTPESWPPGTPAGDALGGF